MTSLDPVVTGYKKRERDRLRYVDFPRSVEKMQPSEYRK